MAGVVIDLGALRHVATLTGVSAMPPTPDGDGGYTQTPVALNPTTWRCAIEAATLSSGSRHFSSANISLATHVFRGRYHSGITTKTLISWVDRAGVTHNGRVLDEDDTLGLGIESVILVQEIAP